MFPTLHWAVFHPEGNLSVFSSHRWILFHEYIASFCKPVQPVPVCRGEEMQNWPITGLLWVIGADSLLLIGILHQSGTCLSCSRRFHSRYIKIWIFINIDINTCNYDLHLCACCHHFMVFGTWADWMNISSLWYNFTDPQTTSAFAFHKQGKIWVHPDGKPR